MPCWTTTTTTVVLEKVDRARLARVAAELNVRVIVDGDRVYVSARDGRTEQELTAAVKQTYAKLTVTEAARKFGWKLQSTTTKQSTTIGQAPTLVVKLGR